MTTMTTVDPGPAPSEPDVEAAAMRLLEDTTTFTEYLSLWLGLEVGLFAALHRAGPLRPEQVAQRADVDARYAREWLEHQTVAGWLTCPNPDDGPQERTFQLSPAAGAVLLDPDSGAWLGPLASMVASVCDVLAELAVAYRTGGGVAYAAYGQRVRHGLGTMNGTTFDHELDGWLDTMPDLRDRLARKAAPHIVDVGCGVGRSTLELARLLPAATVLGVDLDPASIADARAAAAEAGLAHRVWFREDDAAALGADGGVETGPADLVTVFEALHDMGDPVSALAAIRSLVADDGVVYVVDERVGDTFSPAADLVERLQYGFSVLHCLPATMDEDPVVANGTVLRRPTVEAWAAEAGFTTRELDIEDLFWRHYRLDPIT